MRIKPNTAAAPFKRKLLTIAGNPKLDKGGDLGIWAAALHLAPADVSGWNTCASATAGCKAACLNTAGRGGIAAGGILTYETIKAGRGNAVQAARIARTAFLYENRGAFFLQLQHEIAAHIRRCKREGKTPAIRLNATSDIRWESMRVPELQGRTILECFPDVQFYDYTKHSNRKGVPGNYALTFSLADGNAGKAVEAFRNGFNIAAVFRTAAAREAWRAAGGLPGFDGGAIVDGDAHDFRFLDAPRSIVGLYAKGNARRDTSGFVIDAPELMAA